MFHDYYTVCTDIYWKCNRSNYYWWSERISYSHTFKRNRFSLKLSFFTAVISTGIVFFLALPTVYTLTRTRFPLKRVVEILMELTLSLPFILLGLSLLVLFSSDFGKWMKEAGIQVIFSPLGIIAAQTL